MAKDYAGILHPCNRPADLGEVNDAELDRIDSELLLPAMESMLPDFNENMDFLKGLGIGILKNGTYLPCQILGTVTNNAKIQDFPGNLMAPGVNSKYSYDIGVLTADVVSVISGVAMAISSVGTIAGGTVVATAGTALTATGAGAPVGVPAVAISAGVVAVGVTEASLGISLVYSSVSNFGNDIDSFEKAHQDAEITKKAIDDVLKEAKPGRETKGKTSQYIKSGSFEQTNEDFELLNPVDVKEINTNYGLGKTGRLFDGRFITARPGSSDGRPTLEIRATNGRGIEIRYGE